jgi:hypothetical protein
MWLTLKKKQIGHWNIYTAKELPDICHLGSAVSNWWFSQNQHIKSNLSNYNQLIIITDKLKDINILRGTVKKHFFPQEVDICIDRYAHLFWETDMNRTYSWPFAVLCVQLGSLLLFICK